MDIYCPKCAEPWDIDSLHDAAKEFSCTYDEVWKQFKQSGCSALGSKCNIKDDEPRSLKAMASGALMDIMGDDMDGVAATLEDFDYIGLLAEDGLNHV